MNGRLTLSVFCLLLVGLARPEVSKGLQMSFVAPDRTAEMELMTCYGCSDVGENDEEHFTWPEWEPNTEDWGEAKDEDEQVHWDELEGSCDGKHGPCGPEEEQEDLDVDRLAWELDAAGDPGRVLELVGQVEEGRVLFNKERRMLQILGCEGLVVRAFHLRADVISALSVQ